MMFDNKKQDVSPNIDPKALLDEMEERGLIIYNEENDGKFTATEASKYKLSYTEVAIIILPYILDNPAISTRELNRITKVDRKAIQYVRNSSGFATMLMEGSNRIMARGRASALVELEKIINSKTASDNSRIKASEVLLRHTADIAELYQKKNEKKEITHEQLEQFMKELENM